MNTEPAGLYIHIPFCIRKCPYCDFYSVTNDSLKKAFYEALLREMEMTAADISLCFDSLYIGGGTPSVFEAEEIGRIIANAHKFFHISPDTEITLEANPGTVTPEKLRDYRDAGVNRLNIGVQSFQDENLKFLGRIHSSQEAYHAIRWAKKAGFENIGLDFIYGIPGQTRQSWISDLQHAVDIEPAHLSCYMLTLEKGTPLDKKRRDGLFIPLKDAAVADMFLVTVEFAERHDYAQYEISNFARSDSQMSRHNRKYWSDVAYIGFGPSAHSFIPPLRRRNYRSVEKYIRDIRAGCLPVEEKEILGREQSIIESVYLGLRKTEGIDIDLFNRKFGADFDEIFGKVILSLMEKELLRTDKKYCRLTRRGMLFSDSIAAMFIDREF
jgi:oxygen-independent coproporphyrinogen III oxidase